ncbi:hypothetical protein [Photobacterium lipolyticum]|uniref:WD40 repeat protein n=1 Tax=Photobacterium lipolyticum TaxID=266810 RepID=A0A2T3N4A8_9GAMM|nr:hypothetical protein [Photobacterium lipolyticum]PSW07205.1 hypothetical protein C9I89_00290 [Photobacterium lipolyticum]
MTRTLLALSIAGILTAGSMAAFAVHAEPVAWDQHDEVWLTQQTEHFKLNFRQGHEAQANRALDIAEQVHSELKPFFGKAPATRTEIVLVDEYDFSNGWATPLPFAQIRLIMSPPEDVNSLENNDEWMHMLIRHEYAHIMHMEMGEGAVKVFRSIFGRNPFLFPHALTPSFLVEGLAVYLETNKDLGYGRLQGSHYAMEMRMEVASGDVKDLSEVAVATRKWPSGYYYLYGAYFIEYLSNTYGEDKLQAFLQNYSRKLLPYFLLQSSAKKAFGKDFDTLWSDFQTYLNDKYDNDLTQMVDQAVSGKALLTAPFLQVTASSPNGLLVDVNNGEDRNVITQINGSEGEWKTLSREKNIIAMDCDANNGLVVSRLNTYADGRVLADLYLYQDEQWTRLTERERFRKVRWLNDGRHVIASRKQDGLSELWFVDTKAEHEKKRVWLGGSDVVLGAFDISADGQSLVASIKRPHQGWNLELFDLETKVWKKLTDSKAVENSPTFLPDGKVMYSADYDGVYNIYSLDLNAGEVDQLTQEVGGAFEPTWQEGSGLMYQSYDSDGYTLREIDQPRVLSGFDIKAKQAHFDYPEPVQQIAEKSEPEAYSPWSSLRPRTWLPILSADDQQSIVGISTDGADALGRHQYQVSASWDSENSLAAYNIVYQYDNRWLLQLERDHAFSTFTQSGKETYRIEQNDSALLQRSHIYHAFDDQLSLNAGLYLDTSREEQAPKFGAIAPYSGKEETLTGLALTFDNREAYLNVPGIGWGHYVDFVVETNELLNSDYNGEKYQGQWSSTWDLPGRTTATLRLAGGYADDEAKAFRLGGYDLGEEKALFGRDTQALRGYDESVQVGHRYATQRLNVTTWLGRVERNWGLYPVGVGDVSGSVFVDSGAIWDRTQSRKQLTSVGAALTVEAKIGYSFTLPVTLGYAHGFDDKLGKDKVYISVTSSF